MTLMQRLRRAGEGHLIVGGHRGHQSDVRENTIENFSQLDESLIPYIEIDVQQTLDGEIVIFHDAKLEQTTPLWGTVRDHTLEELRSRFEVNTVDEVLAWAGERGMGIAFELKLYPMYTPEERRALARSLTGAIQRHGFHDNCFVFGKDYDTLRWIRKLDKAVNLAIIAPKDPADAFGLMRGLDAFLYLDFLSGLSKELVHELHRAGYLVDGSVVDTETDLKRALELGVDLIESNHPERILDCLKRDSASRENPA